MFQGKYKEIAKSAHKGAIWKYLRSSRISVIKITPVIISRKWISKLYEDFEILFRIPIILSANHHNLEAQPPLAVTKIISHFHLFSFFLIIVYNYFYLFSLINYLYYYFFIFIIIFIII